MNHYQSLFSLKDKVAMVTGSAQGIGAEVAVALGDLGARLVISDRDTELGAQQVAEFEARGVEASFVSLDVTREDQWESAMVAVERQYGRLDVLVNNAGVLFYESLDEMNLDKYHGLMSVNVDGVLMGCKYAARLMQKMGLQSREEAAAFSREITPLQALGTPTDVASAIAFMATPASNFMTGTEIVVDGGISASQ